MKHKILFNGFRHSHIHSLYQRVSACEEMEIAGCTEPDREAREAAQRELGAEFSTKSYEEWLQTDIDAVAIGNAYGERGRMILKALQAGKHVIADKPLCTSKKELDAIRELAEKKHCKIACMLDLRELPQTLTAKAIIDSGELGEIRNVSFQGQHPLNYGVRPSWYFEKGMHGGTLNDLAIHGVDLVRMLTGKEFRTINAARVWNAYADKEKHFRDCATFMATLEGGAGVLGDVSYSAPSQAFSLPSYWEFRLWCEKGLLSFHYTDSAVTVYKQGETKPLRYDDPQKHGDYLREFLQEIREDSFAVTENVLASSGVALWLQEEAEKEMAL